MQLASWDRIKFEQSPGGAQPPPTIPTDANLTMTDQSVDDQWSMLLQPDTDRHGFLVQNTSQNELSIRAEGANATGTRLPGYGDSFSPDFRPEGGYEIKASAANSTFVLAVW